MCTSSSSVAPGRIRANGPTRQPAPIVAPSKWQNGKSSVPGSDAHVPQHAVRPDADVVGERDLAFEHAPDVDRHVAPAAKPAADVDPRRVDNRRAGLHQRAGEARLHEALDRRELRAIVDAERRRGIRGDVRLHRNAVGDRQRDDVRQVVLALDVVVLERGDEPAQERGRRRKRPRVDLVDRALLGCRIALLDDCAHRPIGPADDPAQARWIRGMRREQREPARRCHVRECRVRLGGDQRAIAIRDQRHTLVAQCAERDAGRVARAARRSPA